MTHLSIKTLRHYHDVGVLEPAEVDPASGYRFYGLDQVPRAGIRRFRDLGMPLEDIKAVLQAADRRSSKRGDRGPLGRMQTQLSQMQATVASLRSLLEGPQPQIAVEHRAVPAVQALAIAERVTNADLEVWWTEASTSCTCGTGGRHLPRGTGGALYRASC